MHPRFLSIECESMHAVSLSLGEEHFYQDLLFAHVWSTYALYYVRMYLAIFKSLPPPQFSSKYEG